ncbi:MAG: DMT family transporter [Bacillota bacterium]
MSQLTADLLLILVTVVWGTSFVMVKETISLMGPLTYIAVRFLVAALVLAGWYFLRERRGAVPRSDPPTGSDSESAGPPPAEGRVRPGAGISREFLIGGLLTGFALFASYVTQTLGLVTVGAGKAAFITGMYVVIVPIASQVMLRAAPDRASIIGVALATVGLGLMSLKLPLEIAPGDFLVFLCAIGFAAHILLLGRYSGTGSSVLLTTIQLAVVSVGAFLWAAVTERPLRIPTESWGAILFTAVASTSFAFLAQTAAQRYTSATHTALIFSAEAVFGAFFAWLWAGEVLSAREIAGALFILGGMLVSELPVRRQAPQETP